MEKRRRRKRRRRIVSLYNSKCNYNSYYLTIIDIYYTKTNEGNAKSERYCSVFGVYLPDYIDVSIRDIVYHFRGIEGSYNCIMT